MLCFTLSLFSPHTWKDDKTKMEKVTDKGALPVSALISADSKLLGPNWFDSFPSEVIGDQKSHMCLLCWFLRGAGGWLSPTRLSSLLDRSIPEGSFTTSSMALMRRKATGCATWIQRTLPESKTWPRARMGWRSTSTPLSPFLPTRSCLCGIVGTLQKGCTTLILESWQWWISVSGLQNKKNVKCQSCQFCPSELITCCLIIWLHWLGQVGGLNQGLRRRGGVNFSAYFLL